MSIDIVPARFCADYDATFEVEGSKGAKYQVSWSGMSAHCTCKAFEFSKTDPKSCKHCDLVFKKGCFYNPQWYDGGTRELKPVEWPADGNSPRCPKCGGPTIVVKIAV